MNGQMQSSRRYADSLRRTPGPILPSQLPKVKMDLCGLSHYAAKKGVSLYELSKEEIEMFVPERTTK